MELNDEFDRANWEDTFLGMWLGMPKPVPEDLHELGKGLSGSHMAEVNDIRNVRFGPHVGVRVQLLLPSPNPNYYSAFLNR